jgi:hypothetical protein
MKNYRGYQIQFSDVYNEFHFHLGDYDVDVDVHSAPTMQDAIEVINHLEEERQSYLMDDYVRYKRGVLTLKTFLFKYNLSTVIWNFSTQTWDEIDPEKVDPEYDRVFHFLVQFFRQ